MANYRSTAGILIFRWVEDVVVGGEKGALVFRWAEPRAMRHPEVDGVRLAPGLARRFWGRVQKGGECWIFKGGGGLYGTMHVGMVGSGKRRRAIHKRASHVAWFLQYGEWPTEQVCHHCDNPPCVRIDHLFEGSTRKNSEDCVRKDRTRQKLSLGQVGEIREAWLRGEKKSVIAARYGVTTMTVYRCAHGRRAKVLDLPVLRRPQPVATPRTGAQSPNAKLTDEDVRAMRAEYAPEENRGYVTLARKYGVGRETVRAIIRRETWKHLL